MPQLQAMQWDFKDQLQMTRRQAVNAAEQDGVLHQGQRTYYVYDSSGQRVRKTTFSSAGIRLKERFYLGGYEVYREYDGTGRTTLEGQTLNVMDDKKRIALVETKTIDASVSPASLPITTTRYQFDNHLGTACLELDATSAVITYEEYYPYGATSYQAGRTIAEVKLKRYRYTDKERDEETGFGYHGARYYAIWLGIWTTADQNGLVDGTNLYRFCRNNPTNYVDKTGNVSEFPGGSGSLPDSDVIRTMLLNGKQAIAGVISQAEEVIYEAPPEGKVAAVGALIAAAPEVAVGLAVVAYGGLLYGASQAGDSIGDYLGNRHVEKALNETARNSISLPSQGHSGGPISAPGAINTHPQIEKPVPPDEQIKLPAPSEREISLPPQERNEGLPQNIGFAFRLHLGSSSFELRVAIDPEIDVYAISLIRRTSVADDSRGVKQSDRDFFNAVAERLKPIVGESGPIDVGHSPATPHIFTPNGQPISLRAEPRGANRSGGSKLRAEAKRIRQSPSLGIFVREIRTRRSHRQEN
jgi:RHS repeat-associated protein